LYVVGDIRRDSVRQIVAAVGDGCIVSIKAQNYIENM
jgi:Thioredoxin reductase